MKAILVAEPGKYSLMDVPKPVCGSGEVVIRTAYCGICGTDLEILRGTIPSAYVRYPLIPGHEWTGVVETVGAEVKTLKAGDRVSVEGYLNCGTCKFCRSGATNLCTTHEQIGLTHNGGFAEFVAAPARSCHVLPEHISLDEAVLVEPASTVVRGIERARIRNGARVAILGCGPIGQVAARVVRLYEPETVLGVDPSEVQRSVALKAGMTHFTTSQNREELRALGGGAGWDVVIQCAGGTKPLEMAFSIIGRGGTILVVGGASDSERLTIQANQLVMDDLHIEGVVGYTGASWTRTLELLGAGRLSFQDLISHRLPLTEFVRATELIQSRSEPVGKVVIDYP